MPDTFVNFFNFCDRIKSAFLSFMFSFMMNQTGCNRKLGTWKYDMAAICKIRHLFQSVFNSFYLFNMLPAAPSPEAAVPTNKALRCITSLDFA